MIDERRLRAAERAATWHDALTHIRHAPRPVLWLMGAVIVLFPLACLGAAALTFLSPALMGVRHLRYLVGLGPVLWIGAMAGAMTGMALAIIFACRHGGVDADLQPAILTNTAAVSLGPEMWLGIQADLLRLSRAAGLPARPKLLRIPSQSVNAFAVGPLQRSTVALSDGLVERLAGDEVAAVLANLVSRVAAGLTADLRPEERRARYAASSLSLIGEGGSDEQLDPVRVYARVAHDADIRAIRLLGCREESLLAALEKSSCSNRVLPVSERSHAALFWAWPHPDSHPVYLPRRMFIDLMGPMWHAPLLEEDPELRREESVRGMRCVNSDGTDIRRTSAST